MVTCPLTEIPVGKTCRIKEILADPDIAQHLRELGFVENAEVEILTDSVICKICQAKFGICPKLAEKIIVEQQEFFINEKMS